MERTAPFTSDVAEHDHESQKKVWKRRGEKILQLEGGGKKDNEKADSRKSKFNIQEKRCDIVKGIPTICQGILCDLAEKCNSVEV